jgi:hypothetical protein
MPIPQGGTTPGALNNTTAGSYPFMFGDPTTGILNILDSQTYGVPNPVPIATGLNPNGNLNLGGFGITNASTGSFSGALTIGGTLGVTGITTLTGGVASPLLIGAGLLNTVTITGKATGTDPTITVAGDATRNLGLVLPAASTSTQVGLSITTSAGATAALLGGGASTGYGYLWLGASASNASGTNYSLASNLTNLFLNSGSSIQFDVAAATYLNLTSASLAISGIPIQQNTAATALTLKGNAAATGSTGGVVLVGSQSTTQTSGITLAVQNPAGTSIATVDFAGSFVSASGKFGAITTAGNVGLTLTGNAAAAGTACQIIANTDVTGTGYILGLQSGSLQFAVSGRGHLIPLSTVPNTPASANFNGGYTATAAVTAISVNGSDAAFQLKFTVNGVPTSINAGSVLVTITLAQAYQSTSVVGFACYGKAAGLSDTVGLAVVQNAVGTIQIINTQTFTPVSGTSYVFNVFTMGAGSTS